MSMYTPSDEYTCQGQNINTSSKLSITAMSTKTFWFIIMRQTASKVRALFSNINVNRFILVCTCTYLHNPDLC